MSCCSSPVSQRSSISSTRSSGCHSPSTAATTPSSSGSFSPKIEQMQSFTYSQPSPSSLQEFNNTYNYNYMYPPPSNEVPYTTYGSYLPPQIPSSSMYSQPPSPTRISYQSYDYHDQQPLPPPASPVTSNPVPKYSGYPPASAFYGPSPNSPTTSSFSSSSSSSSPSSSPSSHQSHYRRQRLERINPEEYKFETWYTTDGRKVEYSPMHMNCATM